MAGADYPQWTLSKEEQKRELESHLHYFLSDADSSDLTPHRRFFLSETIGLTFRGLFGMARVSLAYAYEDADQFDYYEMSSEIIERATPAALHRALRYLEGAPAQEHPIFR